MSAYQAQATVQDAPTGRIAQHFAASRGAHAGGRVPLKQRFYLPQLIPALLLVAYGTLVIWSASLSIVDANFPRHLMGVGLGLASALVVRRYDYRVFSSMSTILLVIDALLMVSPRIPGLGISALGMTGVVRIPIVGFTFQPSELAKIVTILMMSSLGAQYNGKIESFADYAKLCGILTIPFLLILVQPDLGTGLIVLVSGATVIICSGAKTSWVVATVAGIVVFAGLVIATSLTPGLPHILKEYQLNRLIVFVDPSVDPGGSGYNLQQAKIAVGSGGLFGKGIGNASQSGSGFLPEAHTDFIFALLAEEFGFVGSAVLIGLFAWMILSTVSLAQRVEAPFAKLVLCGIVSMWTFQVLQEVGMCIGIMPITGIPLPFVSFGLTSMVIHCIAIGLVQSVWCHRTKSG